MAYTFDLGQHSKDATGQGRDNLFCNVNMLLRERNPGKMMQLQPFLTYLLRGMSKLAVVQGLVLRGVPASSVGMVRDKYKLGSSIHWSGFTSTTTDIHQAKMFASKEGAGGLIFRIKVLNAAASSTTAPCPRRARCCCPTAQLTRLVVTNGVRLRRWRCADIVERPDDGTVVF